MENLKELELSEMVQISGGVNVAYEVGYAIGKTLKKVFFLVTLVKYFIVNLIIEKCNYLIAFLYISIIM